jgi:hypothetical protein
LLLLSLLLQLALLCCLQFCLFGVRHVQGEDIRLLAPW